MTKQTTREQREIRAMLAELERSGESIASYARRHGIAKWKLYDARRKLRQTEPAQLVTVEVAHTISGAEPFELLIGEVTVRVPDHFDEAALARLVRTLRAC